MQAEDYDDFTAMVSGLADLHNRTLSEWSLALWWGALKLYDFAAVKDALGRQVSNPDNGHFMPMPGDIVKLIKGTTIDAAMGAWAMVDRAVRVIGTHRDVVFDDLLIHRVLTDMGGWVLMGTKTDRDWPFLAKEFETRYRGYALGAAPEYPPVLEGIANSQNSMSYRWKEPPMLIGCPRAATAVMQGGSNTQLIGMHQASKQMMSLLPVPAPLQLGSA